VIKLSEQVLFGKVTKAGTITLPKKLRMKYHINVGDIVKYADTDKGIEIVPAELTSIPTGIKEIWSEADRKKISVSEIVEKVRKVRSEVYNEEYGT
jgi:AbrB family looped-hinge helix DNA binding protein